MFGDVSVAVAGDRVVAYVWAAPPVEFTATWCELGMPGVEVDFDWLPDEPGMALAGWVDYPEAA